MWHLRTWFSGGHGDGVGLMVGLNDTRSLFQPQQLWFCDSKISPGSVGCGLLRSNTQSMRILLAKGEFSTYRRSRWWAPPLMVSAISEGLRLMFIWKEKEQRPIITNLLGRTGLEFWKLEHDLGKTKEKHRKTSLVWWYSQLTVWMNQITCPKWRECFLQGGNFQLISVQAVGC